MKEWFQNFMIGRYGPDQLSIGLMVIFLILAMTGQLTDVMFIRWLSLVPLVVCIWRLLSRNEEKRRAENRVFLSIWNLFGGRLRQWFRHLQDKKSYRFYKCPQCSQKLRVPKGRGKIEIICPKCKATMTKKT